MSSPTQPKHFSHQLRTWTVDHNGIISYILVWFTYGDGNQLHTHIILQYNDAFEPWSYLFFPVNRELYPTTSEPNSLGENRLIILFRYGHNAHLGILSQSWLVTSTIANILAVFVARSHTSLTRDGLNIGWQKVRHIELLFAWHRLSIYGTPSSKWWHTSSDGVAMVDESALCNGNQ